MIIGHVLAIHFRLKCEPQNNLQITLCKLLNIAKVLGTLRFDIKINLNLTLYRMQLRMLHYSYVEIVYMLNLICLVKWNQILRLVSLS